MPLYDQHVHTFLSFDSTEQVENYLAFQPAVFVATDHFDLHNPSDQFHDNIPDYQQLKKIQQAFQTDTTFLTGIEIGVVPGQETQITDYLTHHSYDLRLVSIHQNGKFDYMSDEVLTKAKSQVIPAYFQQMQTVLENFSGGQILTHFDYGLRRFELTAAELAELAEPQLETIFKLIIKKDMALELNAKSIGKYQNEALYRYAVPLYQSLGGKLFTLGSDAHLAADYQNLFPEMQQLLRDFGVNEVATYVGEHLTLVEI